MSLLIWYYFEFKQGRG